MRWMHLPMLLLACLMASDPVSASNRGEQCSRAASYSVYLGGLHTGTMTRVEAWQGQSAVITSNSHAAILGIATQYQQRAELTWSNTEKAWLTTQFQQQVSGFRSRNMRASFSNNGLDSLVELDGKTTSYHSTQIPLRDVDTLAIQIRELVLQGQQEFSLIRQASDGIEPYQYQVKAPITTQLAPWGELQLIPVEQTGAEDITYYFAPSLDHQLAQARYHGFILQGLIQLESYHSTCKPVSTFLG